LSIQNPPRDHHYVPVFYLKQWCGLNNKLVEFTRKHGNFLAKPVGPKGTGFQTDLYAFPELPPDIAQHLENVFLKFVDNEASYALQKHLKGDNAWSSDQRTAWSRFLISLLIRHPDVMVELRSAASANWERTGSSSQARYEKMKEPHHPATFDEYIHAVDPLIPIKAVLNAIIKAFDNELIGSHINEMHWGVIDLSKASHRLLTADRPLQYQNLKKPSGFIALPISPTKLFIAANSPQSISNVRAQRPQNVVHNVNLFVVSHARRFVFAHDRSQDAFIKSHIHTGMETTPFFFPSFRRQ
jgi:Protein of unknown function (DUF4238)